MTDITKDHDGLDHVYGRNKDVLTHARSRAWQAVNTAMVMSYWEVGRIIIEEEQRGKARAEYGTQCVSNCHWPITDFFWLADKPEKTYRVAS